VVGQRINITAIKQDVRRHETEILDKLGIRCRDGCPHIRCPHRCYLNKRASWRWDADKRLALRAHQPGLVDTVYAHEPAVRIPYRASGGIEVATHSRIAAFAADKLRCAKSSKAIPYGLSRTATRHITACSLKGACS
jgi:hypothetical protein